MARHPALISFLETSILETSILETSILETSILETSILETRTDHTSLVRQHDGLHAVA
jgi:hypothetical protein